MEKSGFGKSAPNAHEVIQAPSSNRFVHGGNCSMLLEGGNSPWRSAAISAPSACRHRAVDEKLFVGRLRCAALSTFDNLLVRPHEISLAERQSVVAQNRVCSGGVKQELRHTVVRQIRLPGELLFFRRARTQHDLDRLPTREL
jgi:hypothetical protein